ncbi:MAG TPA: hypothetical protein VHX88_22275 [Solirubrobacteraceae bacterium]|jgi:hypothetical protein|nr:hypothetical protein [Solirubrobacteraceae bacterium]
MAAFARRVAFAGALALALGSPCAAWGSPADPADPSTTILLSRALGGGLPNAPSLDPVISRDNRIARVAAYDSAATNIVVQPTDGFRNVYLVARAGPYETGAHPIGTPWQYGGTTLASLGMGGASANGDSWGPALSGDSSDAPTCVAFISSASNLVSGDSNGQPDAFVRYLATGRIIRVSVNAQGQQANGPTSQVTVNGQCTRVAFVSSATNLALTHTRNPRWRSAVTAPAPAGVSEVYVRQIGVGDYATLDRGLLGLTFLASATRGHPGRGSSSQASFSRDGQALAFASTAANLGGEPGPSSSGGAISQIYERLLQRQYVRRRRHATLQVLRLTTRLVSVTPRGTAGNGPSTSPSVGQDGENVAFQTQASDLMGGCADGHVQIVERTGLLHDGDGIYCVSKSSWGGVGEGDSLDPTMTDAGQDVYFDTDAANLQPLGRQGSFGYSGARDVVTWDRKIDNIRLIEDLAYNDAPSVLPAQVGDGSSRGNYIPFTSTDADLDPLDTGVPSVAVQVPIGCGGRGHPACPTSASSSLSTVTVGALTITGVTLYEEGNHSPEYAATSAPTRTVWLTPAQASPVELALGAVFPMPSSEQVYLRYVGPDS